MLQRQKKQITKFSAKTKRRRRRKQHLEIIYNKKGLRSGAWGWRCSDIINSDTCYENLIDGSHWDENALNENLKGYENLKRSEKKSVSIKYENLKGYEKNQCRF
jgi:hypothetical protein